MHQSTTDAVQFPGASKDVLTGILRQGAQKLLAQAVEAEVDAYIRQHAELPDADGYSGTHPFAVSQA